MSELRAAVIGAGRLGTHHARKYAAMQDVHLRYVADIDESRARKLAAAHGAQALADYRQLAGKVDLATIAAPCSAHYEIASFLLGHGIDVLLEKPMAATLDQARDLAAAAARYNRIFQIGHLERFNPAIVGLRPILKSPRFIECHRLAPFTERGTDVDVILDLMIHDLDVILSLTGGEIASVEAIGIAALTDQIDVANARLKFRNGLIANVNTSRVANRRERKIRFFQPDAYISVDYEARRIQAYRKGPPPPGSPFPSISAEEIDVAEGDPLADEVAAFVRAVREHAMPAVTAADGLRVMEVCERIREAMNESASTSTSAN